MRKHHAQNERIKREYFSYLEKARRMSQSSVDQAAAAIAQFAVRPKACRPPRARRYVHPDEVAEA